MNNIQIHKYKIEKRLLEIKSGSMMKNKIHENLYQERNIILIKFAKHTIHYE